MSLTAIASNMVESKSDFNDLKKLVAICGAGLLLSLVLAAHGWLLSAEAF